MGKYSDIWHNKIRHKSDKWDHYFDIYDHCLSKFYGKRISLLEIGVQHGGSLEVAQNLFDSKSTISGLDVDKRCLNLLKSLKNIKIYIGSQVDESILNRIAKDHNNNFDIIIDDGSHVQGHMIFTFTRLFQFLNNGGVYIIEDTHTNYSYHHQESFYGIGLYDYFKGLSERLNLDFLNPNAREDYKIPRNLRQRKKSLIDIHDYIFSIEFFDSIIAIRKKSKTEPLRLQK